jgi:predicted dehydrogenase
MPKTLNSQHDRLRLHGQGALERLAPGRELLSRVGAPAGAESSRRAYRGRGVGFRRCLGYEGVETDWRRLITRDDIDLVDICVPNHMHKEIALAAAAAGKWIACEKPLAMNAAEGEAMVAAVERARVPNLVWYNYRRVPAITLAKQLIDEGRIGRPYHYRAQFLQDWTIAPDVPQGGTALWRLDVRAAAPA